MDEFSSIIRKNPELAPRLVAAIESLERGDRLDDALERSGVSPEHASVLIAEVKRALSGEAAQPESSPRRKAARTRGPAKKARGGGVGRVVAFSDGGARGNPGEAACAAILYDGSGEELLRRSKRLGRATNNVAEYEGAILALELSGELGARDVVLRVDSELIARQIQGRYKVKHPGLKPFHARALVLARAFASFSVECIPRGDNAEADTLVNASLDGQAED